MLLVRSALQVENRFKLSSLLTYMANKIRVERLKLNFFSFAMIYNKQQWQGIKSQEHQAKPRVDPKNARKLRVRNNPRPELQHQATILWSFLKQQKNNSIIYTLMFINDNCLRNGSRFDEKFVDHGRSCSRRQLPASPKQLKIFQCFPNFFSKCIHNHTCT